MCKYFRFEGVNHGTCVNAQCDDPKYGYKFFDGTQIKYEYFSYGIPTVIMDAWFATSSFPDINHGDLNCCGNMHDHLNHNRKFTCQVNCASKII